MGLFSGNIDSRGLKVKLKQIERERRKSLNEITKSGGKQSGMIEQIKTARKEGNNTQVDYLWEELKDVKNDIKFHKQSIKVSSLEAITLKKVIRGLERLEKRKDKDGVAKLIRTITTSGLSDKLEMQTINEQAYLDELNSTLGDMGIENDDDESSEKDPDKDKFLSDIDALNEAEETGDFSLALEKEEQIRKDVAKDLAEKEGI